MRGPGLLGQQRVSSSAIDGARGLVLASSRNSAQLAAHWHLSQSHPVSAMLALSGRRQFAQA